VSWKENRKDRVDFIAKELLQLFPEAKQTMRDRLPTSMLLSAAILDIRSSIKDIKYTADELRESVMGFVAMIPDSLKDEEFNEEMRKTERGIPVDVRPVFCGVKASPEYCRRKGIPIVQCVRTFDYLAVFHACFNLLDRKHMLLQIDRKEISEATEPVSEEEEE